MPSSAPFTTDSPAASVKAPSNTSVVVASPASLMVSPVAPLIASPAASSSPPPRIPLMPPLFLKCNKLLINEPKNESSLLATVIHFITSKPAIAINAV